MSCFGSDVADCCCEADPLAWEEMGTLLFVVCYRIDLADNGRRDLTSVAMTNNKMDYKGVFSTSRRLQTVAMKSKKRIFHGEERLHL